MSTTVSKLTSQNRIYYKCPVCPMGHRIPVKPHDPNGWDFNQNFEKPTLSPSVHAFDNEKTLCHHFVKDGKIQFCGDTPHELAGKTVDMELIE